MEEEKRYRKLNVELPVEPIRNSQPWLVLGVLFALAILLLIMYLFLTRGQSGYSPKQLERFTKL